MKKKIIICIYVVLLLVCGKQVFNYFYNEYIIDNYEEGFLVDTNPLRFLNIYEPYVAHYNMGNSYYLDHDYETAISEYHKALEYNLPTNKECSIRINLSLAMIKNLGDDYAESDNIKGSINTLKEARDVLLKEDCATKDGDGHSKTAEELKEEIEKLLEELEAQAEGEEVSDDSKKEIDNQETKEDELENNIKEELQQIQSDSYQERQEQLQFMEEFDMEINFDLETPIW